MSFSNDVYDSIEELKKEYDEIVKQCFETEKEPMKKQGYNLTKFQIYCETEYGYYNDTSTAFGVHIYRSETDAEYVTRMEKNQKQIKTRELTKKLEHEKLMKDPEYQQLLKLKEKFKLK